jgi:hypothetical protein
MNIAADKVAQASSPAGSGGVPPPGFGAPPGGTPGLGVLTVSSRSSTICKPRWLRAMGIRHVATPMIDSPSQRRLCHHPEKIRSLSPGLRGTSYPGCAMGWGINPERVASSPLSTVVKRTVWWREPTSRCGESTLTGLVAPSMLEPRVARTSQPWAEGYNPFGIAQYVQTPTLGRTPGQPAGEDACATLCRRP